MNSHPRTHLWMQHLYGQSLTKCCVSYIISHHMAAHLYRQVFSLLAEFWCLCGHSQLQTDTQLTWSIRPHSPQHDHHKQVIFEEERLWNQLLCRAELIGSTSLFIKVEISLCGKGAQKGMIIVFVKVYSLRMSVSMMEPLLMKKTTRQAIKSHELTIRF